MSGHDLHSLLFNFLDELLFVYATEYIMLKHIAVSSLDTAAFSLTATGCVASMRSRSRSRSCARHAKCLTRPLLAALPACLAWARRGERFDRHRHECGTEVKAITYSAMQVLQADGDAEVFVIVDI